MRRPQDKDLLSKLPVGLYPLALRDSAACGLCMECLRACPQDNLALNLRPFGSDLAPSRPVAHPERVRSLDAAWLALVMLGSALAFAAVFVGPWGWLKSAAYAIGSLQWAGYALAFLALNLIILPGLFALAVWAGQKLSGGTTSLRRAIASQAQALLPLGLMAWIAFTISFALPKLSFVVGVLNDPFGWGWSLLGTAGAGWSPDVSAFSPLLQAALLLLGVFWGSDVTRRLAENERRPWKSTLPVLGFCLAFVLGMLWLLVG
jgi:hypothetical protein